ncbi:MAG: phosphodiester glycosidase family protein [Acidimicrobiales bacterium]
MLAAAVLVLIPVVWLAVSYASWMLAPTSESFGARSAEWVRSLPGGNFIVDKAEHYYYGSKAPKPGGPQLKRLPSVGLSDPTTGQAHRVTTTVTTTTPSAQTAPWPPPIKPVFAHPLPGEGIWKPTGPPVDGGPPVLVTTYRPELEYPQIVAYVAWFDHSRTALAYYPGRYEPPHAAVRGPMMVPNDQRYRLLATFNAGFIYSDGTNGSADNGLVNEPLTDGNATLIGYRNGTVAIVKWSAGSHLGPNVAWARQSLAPIVWNGQLNPTLNTNPNSPQWGYTLGGVTQVWRTGVGIDRHGNLIFVVANDQTVISLAQILQHVGAVDAMEFDINPYWHTLITYTHAHGLSPTMVEPQPNQSPDRYLVPDDRDFFAVYRRLPGPITVPFN